MSESMLNTETEEFKTLINNLGYAVTMEHVKLQISGPAAIEQVKANMTALFTEFAKIQYDAGYDRGMDAGVGLSKMVGND
jgi:hypothetical protein